MGKLSLIFVLLLFPVSYCLSQEILDHQYGLALSTLTALSGSSSRHASPLSRLFSFLHSNFLQGFLPFEFSAPSQRLQDALPSVESIEILPLDSPLVKRAKAIKILTVNGQEHQHPPSLMTLGNIYLFGHFQHPRNVTNAFEQYMSLASLGNATAQRMVGLLYATGVGTERNYAKAHIYMSFAALGNDLLAKQVLAYWYTMGIGVGKSYEEAAFYYVQVAEKITQMFYEGPPLGRSIPETPVRIPDKENQGIFGKGVSGPGDPNQKTAVGGGMTTRDVVEYLSLQSDSGDASAQLVVGQVYYQGAQGVPIDYVKARRYFQMAARILSSKQSPTAARLVKDKLTIAGQAAGFLGQIYWRGEGVVQNNETARKWYEKGEAVRNPACLYALGVMNEQGIAGLKKNLEKARLYYSEAAKKENSDAMTRMAQWLETQDPVKAFNLYLKSASKGDIVASYKVGVAYVKGMGTTQNFQRGVTYLKNLVEKACWHDPYIQDAYKSYEAGDYDAALVKYILSAEFGLEVAQTNAAWLLEKKKFSNLESIYTNRTENHYYMSHILWNRAANQNNVDARVKLGDFNFHGKLANGTRAPDYQKAVQYYRVAAENEYSSLAMWNLGWMYENGLGVEQDFHLAKRLYDQCLSVNPGAYLPIRLALMKLYLRWFWLWIQGKAGPTRPFDKVEDLKASIHKSDPLLSDEPHDSEEVPLITDTLLILFLILLGSILYYWRGQILSQPIPPFEPLEEDYEEESLESIPSFEEDSPDTHHRQRKPFSLDNDLE